MPLAKSRSEVVLPSARGPGPIDIDSPLHQEVAAWRHDDSIGVYRPGDEPSQAAFNNAYHNKAAQAA